MIQIAWKKYLAGFTILAIIAFVPHGLLDQTSRPAFCDLCHPMHPQYEVWFLTGVHREINCVRCHNEMVSRISTEGRDCWSFHRRINHKLNEFSYSGV
ncbi:MAG: hypothetical protein JW807_10085 [Spirochaetes bacterium]|nr:hypothetical protein [Spirochaetota bacterium]